LQRLLFATVPLSTFFAEWAIAFVWLIFLSSTTTFTSSARTKHLLFLKNPNGESGHWALGLSAQPLTLLKKPNRLDFAHFRGHFIIILHISTAPSLSVNFYVVFNSANANWYLL
jgi:hypothetical protein